MTDKERETKQAKRALEEAKKGILVKMQVLKKCRSKKKDVGGLSPQDMVTGRSKV